MSTSEIIALWSAVATGAGVVVGFFGLIFIHKQLARMAEANSKMAEANKLANAMAVVTIEEALRSARAELAEASLAVVSNANVPGRDIEPYRLAMEEKTERYLNVFDRLCACIRRGIIEETTYRQDYRRGIAETIDQHKTKFGPDTRHANILHVHRAWSEDRSARDGA